MESKNKSISELNEDKEEIDMKLKDSNNVEAPICRIYWQVEQIRVIP